MSLHNSRAAEMDMKSSPRLMLYVVFLFFSLKSHVSLAADRITANQSLSGDQTIVSSGGIFELGFFKPGNSSIYYIGIWYNGVPELTSVWVANRETPVSDRFAAELRMSDGNLILFNESKFPIWSTGLNSSSSSSVEAVLYDEGNLVLSDGSNSPEPLWQSFDHPGDTWLPGIKLGYNKITKRNTVLTSWRNKEDPAPGLFSLGLNPNGTSEYYMWWNMSNVFWSSGTWNAQGFSQVPEMRLTGNYNYSYIENDNEKYFIYFPYNSSIINRVVMDVGGQMQHLSLLEPSKQWYLFWSQPRVQCEVYAYCGAFGSCNAKSQPFCQCLRGFEPKSAEEWGSEVYSGGCVRQTSLQCGNSSLANAKRDQFFPIYNKKSDQNPVTVAAGSAQDCESTCSSNCSCTAYAYDSNQCSVWLGDLLDLQDDDSNGTTFYIRLAASQFSSSKTGNGIIIGAVIGAAALVALLCLVAFVIFRSRKTTIKAGVAVEGSVVAFGYRDLQNATKNFSQKLGGGGFGTVFKGLLPNSSVIAVKKLESISQGEKQFRTEVSTIGTIQHVNLVRLRGFCSEGIRKLLVYDYMPNGSLDSHLFHENVSKVLDWKTRHNIALGTARGLAYLHEKCRDCIIHCDIKPENILLDANFCPRVADFGLAKLFGRDFSRVLTTMRGTRGYLAPEWISGVAITAKADVYSYGMMLFEIISGRRNSEHSENGKMKFFPTWATTQIAAGGNVLSLLDPKLEKNADLEELTRMSKVATWCIQDDETQRPSMGQVVQILEGILDVNVPPVPRSLQVFVDNQESIIFFSESSSSSHS